MPARESARRPCQRGASSRVSPVSLAAASTLLEVLALGVLRSLENLTLSFHAVSPELP